MERAKTCRRSRQRPHGDASCGNKLPLPLWVSVDTSARVGDLLLTLGSKVVRFLSASSPLGGMCATMEFQRRSQQP
jgi:hypothetical protein